MATFGQLKNRIVFILGDDPNESTDISDDLLSNAIDSALDAILPQCWKPSLYTLTGSASRYALPADVYEVQGVYDSGTRVFLDPAVLAPGEPSSSSSGNGWLEYPYGYISLYTALSSSGGVLYYAAKWTKPVNESDVIDAPEYAVTALTLYGASYAVLNKAAAAAALGNYKTRLDSGTPEDQPLQNFANYLLKRYETEMMRMPKQTKGVK